MANSPLFEFFKRGEVARDVRILAAQGALAPRAHEQLGILVLLLDDPDPEVRRLADDTLGRIPTAALAAFLARNDVSVDLREFFADRGIFPADTPAEDAEAPLIESDPDGELPEAAADDTLPGAEADGELPDEDADGAPPGEDAGRLSINQRIASMTFLQRLKAAMKGSREMRSILIRDPNKMISAAVLSSPKLTEQEVAGIARMASVPEDVLRTIAANRAWMKNYKIASALTRNPKAPVAMTLNLLQRLSDRDVQSLAVDRNVPEPLRIAARKKVVASTSKK